MKADSILGFTDRGIVRRSWVETFLLLTQNLLGYVWNMVFNILYKKPFLWRTTKLVRNWSTEERLMELELSRPEKQSF